MIEVQTENIVDAVAKLTQASLDFNEIANKGDSFSEEAIANQIKLINEEVLEINEAFRQNDAVEVLDGVLDTYVVLTGLLQQLQAAGVLVGKAAELVAENNLSKFPKELMVAEASVKALEEKRVKCSIDFNSKYDVYCIKDTNSKVRKPIYFESVNLKECVPASLIIHGFTKEQ